MVISRHEPFPSISMSTSFPSVSPTFFGLVGFRGLNISLKKLEKLCFFIKNGFFSSFRSSDPFRQNEVKENFDLIDFRRVDYHLRISFEKSKGRDFQSRRFFSSDGRFMRECSIFFLDGRNRLLNRRTSDRYFNDVIMTSF